MKIDAISSHECSTIIRHLAISGKWRNERMGARIELARIKTPSGGQVQYAVTIHRTVVNGNCKTVATAVDEVNQIIHGRPPVAMAGRAARDPERPGMPALVRQRSCQPAAARLFEEA